MEDVMDLTEEITISLNDDREKIEWEKYRSLIDNLKYFIESLAEARLKSDLKNILFSIYINPISIKSFSFKLNVGNDISANLVEEINHDFNDTIKLLRKDDSNTLTEHLSNTHFDSKVNTKLNSFNEALRELSPSSISIRQKSGKSGIKRTNSIKRTNRTIVYALTGTSELSKFRPAVAGIVKLTTHLDKVDEIKPMVGFNIKNIDEIHPRMRIEIDSITFEGRRYLLNTPLVLEDGVDDGFYYLKSEILDIYANGNDINEALEDLYEDFDYLYRRLMELSDNQLGERMLKAKRYLELTVKNVENVSI